jgi:chaperonin cofactor prefoldin
MVVYLVNFHLLFANMNKKIIKKKYTLESVSKQLNERIDGIDNRISDLKNHMDKRFDEQTVEFSNQIRDVLDLVDERLKPVEQTRIGI